MIYLHKLTESLIDEMYARNITPQYIKKPEVTKLTKMQLYGLKLNNKCRMIDMNAIFGNLFNCGNMPSTVECNTR